MSCTFGPKTPYTSFYVPQYHNFQGLMILRKSFLELIFLEVLDVLRLRNIMVIEVSLALRRSAWCQKILQQCICIGNVSIGNIHLQIMLDLNY